MIDLNLFLVLFTTKAIHCLVLLLYLDDVMSYAGWCLQDVK